MKRKRYAATFLENDAKKKKGEDDTSRTHCSRECTHDEIFENLCCLCGKQIATRNGYRVRDATAQDLSRGGGHLVKQKSTQSVIFDIDNTILVSSTDPQDSTYCTVEYWDTLGLWIMWRPHVVDNIDILNANGVDVYLQTKGTRAYADRVKRSINEKVARVVVRDENVISRDEERGAFKSLTHFFSDKDPHVVIVDDRIDVWKNDALYVIQVTPWDWSADVRINEDAEEVQNVFAMLKEIFAARDTTFVETVRRIVHHREQEAEPDADSDAVLLHALTVPDEGSDS